MRNVSWAAVSLLAAGAFALSGCASNASPGRSSAPRAGHVLAGSRPALYASLPELSHDAAVVLTGTVTAQQVDTNGPVPVTLSTIAVTTSWQGAPPGTVLVRQLGAPGDTIDEGVPVLRTGSRYALFLSPFERVHGEAVAGQYVITGNAGAYADDGTTLTRLDPASLSLPPRIPVADFDAAIRG